MMQTSDEFLRFVRPQWTSLHRVARRYVAGEEDVRDLVQETLLRAWRSFSPTDTRTYNRAWLYVIMRSAATDWQRAASRRVRLVPTTDAELTELAPADLSEPLPPLSFADESRFREFLDERIVAALDALDAPFREVVILSVAGDLAYREIAEVLDCPVGTVMSRMARARRALRDELAAFATKTGWIKERPS